MGRAPTIRLTAVVIVAVAALAGNALRSRSPRLGPPFGLDSIAPMGGEAAFDEVEMDRPFLDMLGAREVLFRGYNDGGEPVWVFAGFFDRQKEGSQVHSPKHCYPGSGWSIEDERRVSASWGGARVSRLLVSRGAEKRLVYFWFRTPQGVESDVFGLKYRLTRRAILGQSQEVVFVRVSSTVGKDAEAVEARLARWARAVDEEVARRFRSRL